MSLEEYKKYLMMKKLSDKTIYDYLITLKLVERFLGKPIDKANKEDIERFLSSISNCKPNSILSRLLTLKLYFKWLGKPEISDFPLPKTHNNGLVSSDLITEEEILKMINVCDNLRDKCLIALLYDSACRRGEITNLNIEDVVIESERTGYIVVNGKTGKRQVPLSFSIPVLKEWINKHPLKDKPSSPLFISTENYFGHRLIDDSIRNIVLRYCKRIGLKKRIFPHLFRHSRLTDLDKKGLSHTAMKYYAGWSKNSNMPSVYSHFSAQDTKELVYQADGITPIKRKKTILEPVNCVKCNTPNDKTNRYCYLCGMALDEDSKKEFEIEELLKLLIKTDPNLSKTISDKIKQLKSNS